MNKPLFPLILSLLLLSGVARGQEFGGNPPSIKWNQVNTPAAKVIFPAGLDTEGLRVANIVTQMNKAIQSTIGFKQRQVSILMQNQTTITNAYVQLAPFRSEFFLTPEQNSFDIGSLPWPEQLAIHEFRHVQQYNNFDVGLSKAMRFLFGEGGQAVANDLAVPNWFFEGDAVFNETHVSEQGRGRLPFFFDGFRALWADGVDYSYMKIRNGSYIDYTPDWYPLGYMMVSYGRQKYGDDFWKKVTHDAAAYKGGFYPFEQAIKKYSGKDFVDFRNDALNYFRQQFVSVDQHNVPQPKKHFDADREYPAYIDDHTIIYSKTTYDKTPVFVIKEGNKEKTISTRSYSLDNYFDYRNGKIIYVSYRPDLRWNYRDYSELILLDVKTGKEHRLTKSTKYFAPSFSADGKTIAVVQEATSGKCDVHLLDAATGKLLAVVPNKQHLFYTYPKFYGRDHLVAGVRNSKGQMSLAIINIKTGDARYLLPFTYQPIVFPHLHGDTAYFSATSDINDRLFAINLKNKKLYELKGDSLQTFIGNYETSVSAKKLAWVSLTAYGYQIHQIDNSAIQWDELPDGAIPGTLPNFNITALTRDSSTNLLASVQNKPMDITKYHKAYHLFNFHSLVPNINDPNYTLEIQGENVLNTFQSDILFNYNRDEGYKQFGFDALYGALFPYISGAVNYIVDRRELYRGNNVYWNETNVQVGLELPLNFTQGKSATSLAIGSDIVYSSNSFQQAYRSLLTGGSYAYLFSYLNFYNSTLQAQKNIFPQFAQSIQLQYENAVTGQNSTQFLATGTFYFPGLFLNHSLFFNAAYQQKGSVNNVIDYSNNFPFSRGYMAENYYKMDKLGANYSFPIAYPDAGVANTIYIMRIRGNAFYDYTHANDFYTDGSKFKANFNSTGLEIYFDTKWFNQESISFGFRYDRLLDPDLYGGTGRNRFEFIVPVSIF
ncbi:TolB family protein [Mucilaginibacter sp.]